MSCNWDGPANERNIRHILGCEECKERWPLIAADPQAAAQALRAPAGPVQPPQGGDQYGNTVDKEVFVPVPAVDIERALAYIRHVLDIELEPWQEAHLRALLRKDAPYHHPPQRVQAHTHTKYGMTFWCYENHNATEAGIQHDGS